MWGERRCSSFEIVLHYVEGKQFALDETRQAQLLSLYIF